MAYIAGFAVWLAASFVLAVAVGRVLKRQQAAYDPREQLQLILISWTDRVADKVGPQVAVQIARNANGGNEIDLEDWTVDEYSKAIDALKEFHRNYRQGNRYVDFSTRRHAQHRAQQGRPRQGFDQESQP